MKAPIKYKIIHKYFLLSFIIEDCILEPFKKKSINKRIKYIKKGEIKFNTVIKIFLIIIIALLLH